MQIKLAGYNVETDILEELETAGHAPLTPETFSSAYARISRSEKDVTSLRQEARADVDKARKSNKKIIFEMGHHSVAEHAVFNFDMLGVSRLAMEEIEKFRLVSYTEKSQRYVTLDGDYVVPAEISDRESLVQFKHIIKLQNNFYKKAYEVLKEYLFTLYPQHRDKKAERKVVEGWAKEDARYILSLATEGQLGMTINARNLEHMFRRFALSSHQEVRQIGSIIHGLVARIAPSLILFPEPSAFEKDLASEQIRQLFAAHVSEMDTEATGFAASAESGIFPLKILDFSSNSDEKVLAALFVRYLGIDYQQANYIISLMSDTDKEEIFKSMFARMEFFDAPPREFELPDITFQAIVCASNFAQLKRHRLASLITGEYQLKLGNVIPENIKITKLDQEFYEIISQTNDAYEQLKKKHGPAADYILTNSHCRRVVMKMNLREAYHFIRLRADEHAQWDIRQLAFALAERIHSKMPLTAMLLCGKSDYSERYQSIYGQQPSFTIS